MEYLLTGTVIDGYFIGEHIGRYYYAKGVELGVVLVGHEDVWNKNMRSEDVGAGTGCILAEVVTRNQKYFNGVHIDVCQESYLVDIVGVVATVNIPMIPNSRTARIGSG